MAAPALDGAAMMTVVDDVELVRARPPDPGELADGSRWLRSRGVAAVNVAAAEILPVWGSSPCDVSGPLRLTERSVAIVQDPRPGCDAMPITRGIVLEYGQPVDASALSWELSRPVVEDGQS